MRRLDPSNDYVFKILFEDPSDERPLIAMLTAIFVRRLVYYWSRAHSQQLDVGDEYASLRPTISIAWLADPLDGSRPIVPPRLQISSGPGEVGRREARQRNRNML